MRDEARAAATAALRLYGEDTPDTRKAFVLSMDALATVAMTPVERDGTWADVREGFEVLAPNGAWFPIVSVPPWHEDDGTLSVTMNVNGREGTYSRKPADPVRVRYQRDAESEATDLLAEMLGAQIIGRSEA